MLLTVELSFFVQKKYTFCYLLVSLHLLKKLFMHVLCHERSLTSESPCILVLMKISFQYCIFITIATDNRKFLVCTIMV